MRYKKIVSLMLFVLLSVVLCAGQAYSDGYINLLPKVVKGSATVTTIGKDFRRATSYTGEVNNDVHQVQTLTCSDASVISLVEYLPTDPYFIQLTTIFSQVHAVRVRIIPPGNNAFVLLSESKADNSYKVCLNTSTNQIIIQRIVAGMVVGIHIAPYAIKPYQAYDIQVSFGYESSGGSGGNRISITTTQINSVGVPLAPTTIFNKKLYDIGLQGPSTPFPPLLKFYVGSSYCGSAIFSNEWMFGN